MVKELIREKRAQLQKGAPPQQDLITSLLSIRNEENEEVISEKEVVDNAVIVMAAGHDTASILITFLIRLFASNPDVHASVLQEQDAIAKSKTLGEFLTWEDLSKMKYTWRVATEMLRLVPPVFGGFRTVLKDIEYEGYTIPKDWKLFWVAGMTHMDENIFPDPAKFDPSRFESQVAAPPYCYVPFGGGPRICPGMEFARIETLVSIHHIVTRFTWKLLADLSFGRTPAPEPSKGLPIEIKPRNVYYAPSVLT
jgi:cytochrome P450 family 26 subfamily A